MKALISQQPGEPKTLVLADVPDPVPAAGEVLVAVHACGINFLDTLIVIDQYQVKPPRPFAPGVEVAGTVLALGAGVTGLAPGDRVMGIPAWGGLAEQVCVPATHVFPLPDAVSFTEGAGLPIAYGTALHALRDRGRMRAGECLLVLGAGGGAGLAAVELGKALGLRVVGAVSGADKADAVRAAGADAVVVYDRAPLNRDQSRALVQAFRAACGGEGADIVYDAVGGDYAEPALRACAWGARYLIVGFAAGIPALPFNLALLKSADLCGVFYGGFAERDPAHNRVLCAELLDLAAAGRISAHVNHVVPLARGAEAIALLAQRKTVGKVVVTIRD